MTQVFWKICGEVQSGILQIHSTSLQYLRGPNGVSMLGESSEEALLKSIWGNGKAFAWHNQYSLQEHMPEMFSSQLSLQTTTGPK